jgi:hypothetical protein
LLAQAATAIICSSVIPDVTACIGAAFCSARTSVLNDTSCLTR